MYYALRYIRTYDACEVPKGEVKYDYNDPKPLLFARIFLSDEMISRVLNLF